MVITWNSGSLIVNRYASSKLLRAAIRVSGTYFPPKMPYLPNESGRSKPLKTRMSSLSLVCTSVAKVHCTLSCEFFFLALNSDEFLAKLWQPLPFMEDERAFIFTKLTSFWEVGLKVREGEARELGARVEDTAAMAIAASREKTLRHTCEISKGQNQIKHSRYRRTAQQ